MAAPIEFVFADIPWGYLFNGMLLAAGLTWLVLWLRGRSIKVRWYEWLILAIGILLVEFGIQNFFSALHEFERMAMWRFLLVFSLPGLILLAVTYQLVWRRHRATG